MKRILTLMLTVAMLATFVMPAMATDSRQMALGLVGNYIEDDYNIFTWYATLPSYSNLIMMNIHSSRYYGYGYWGETDIEPFLGATYAFGEDGDLGTLAMFFYSDTRGPNPIYMLDIMIPYIGLPCASEPSGIVMVQAPWPGLGVFSENVYNKFSVMYGYAMEGLSFGLFFNRSDWGGKAEVTPGLDLASEEYSEHVAYMTLGAGGRFDIGDEMSAEVAFDINMVSYEDKDVADFGGGPTAYAEEQDASMMMGFRGRFFYEWDETFTFVPYISYRMFDFSLKRDVEPEAFKYGEWGAKGMMVDFGIGSNIAVNEDNLLVFAIEPFSYAKVEPSEIPTSYDYYYWCGGSLDFVTIENYSLESKMLVMPRFRLALESDVKSWLTFRVGGIKSLWKGEATLSGKVDGVDTDFTETETAAPFEYFMGLGFHIGDFDIDCVINNQLPYYMGYWLTGNQYDGDGGSLVYMVSGIYSF